MPRTVPWAVLVYPPASHSDSEDGKTHRTAMMECMAQKLGCSSESARGLIKTETVGLYAQ